MFQTADVPPGSNAVCITVPRGTPYMDKSGKVRMMRGGRKWVKEVRKWVLWLGT